MQMEKITKWAFAILHLAFLFQCLPWRITFSFIGIWLHFKTFNVTSTKIMRPRDLKWQKGSFLRLHKSHEKIKWRTFACSRAEIRDDLLVFFCVCVWCFCFFLWQTSDPWVLAISKGNPHLHPVLGKYNVSWPFTPVGCSLPSPPEGEMFFIL